MTVIDDNIFHSPNIKASPLKPACIHDVIMALSWKLSCRAKYMKP